MNAYEIPSYEIALAYASGWARPPREPLWSRIKRWFLGEAPS